MNIISKLFRLVKRILVARSVNTRTSSNANSEQAKHKHLFKALDHSLTYGVHTVRWTKVGL